MWHVFIENQKICFAFDLGEANLMESFGGTKIKTDKIVDAVLSHFPIGIAVLIRTQSASRFRSNDLLVSIRSDFTLNAFFFSFE